MSELIHSDPSHHSPVFQFYSIISARCKCTLCWLSTFSTKFLRHIPQPPSPIYYKHSSILCYEIKKETSCGIHMHSGKSYNPVSCERAQVTPLIGPPSLLWTGATANPLLSHTHPNVQKEKKSLNNTAYETFV